jgi:transposase
MGEYSGAFVAFDVAKAKHALPVAEPGRSREVRFLCEIENTPGTIERTVKELGARYDRLQVCFEAGPTGYGLYRQIQELGHECVVVAPALIPKRPDERVKNGPARCGHPGASASVRRADGCLGTDAVHEAIRDLVRARGPR